MLSVLARFGITPTGVEDLKGAGGFSGAHLWRVTAGDEVFCLRKWPAEHPSEDRLTSIHRTQQLAASKLSFIPRLQLARADQTYVRHEGRLWELSTWMPGVADFKLDPRLERLQAALRALAQWHIAVTDAGNLAISSHRESPGLKRRLQQLDEYRISPNYGAARIMELALRCGSPELAHRAQRLIAGFWRYAPRVHQLLNERQLLAVPMVTCLCDIWHDHVLFTGDVVTGIVDFGAVKTETVAGDLARLLGSLVPDDAEAWRIGLTAYDEVRKLSANERLLIEAFDRSSVLMTGMQWLTWLLVEQRTFENLPVVFERMDVALARLEHPNHGGL